MLHKKRKPSTFTSSSGFASCKRNTTSNNMLHSKSTYFYRWLASLGVARRSYNSTNGIRCPSHHCEQASIHSDTAHAILTRDSRETMPYSRIASYAGSPDGKGLSRQANSYSKITDRPGYMVPVGCGLALLLGLGTMLNPATNISSIDKAYAETITANPTDYSSISLTISHSNTDGSSTELNTGDTVSTSVEPGLVSYITNNLRIDTKKINRFYVSIQAAEDSSSELTGIVNKATIAPVGSNKIPTATDDNGFGDNTWGFALGEANTANESMSYNSLPVYGTSTTPQYSSASNLADGAYNLKLTFAAKINADKPSDHYTTKAMVSVAADVRQLVGFLDSTTKQPITTMQEMTTATCQGASEGYSTTLRDTRDNKHYWVAKLADDNCWMTQNLALDLYGKVLLPKDSDIDVEWDGAKDVASDLWAIDAENPNIIRWYSSGDYKDHTSYGNYYTFAAATAGEAVKMTQNANVRTTQSICPKGWTLPVPILSDNPGADKSYEDLLITSYGFKHGESRKDYQKALESPLYFTLAGYVDTQVQNAGSYARYWQAAAASAGTAWIARFDSYMYPQTSIERSVGASIRCVAK